MASECFAVIVHDLRVLLRRAAERTAQPAAAQAQGLELAVVKLPEAKWGCVWVLKRWVIERDFACASRFHRLARDDERLAAPLAGLHFLAFVCLMLHQFTVVTVHLEQPLSRVTACIV